MLRIANPSHVELLSRALEMLTILGTGDLDCQTEYVA